MPKPKRPKNPDAYKCANCRRTLVLSGYSGSPLADTPDERIHRITDPSLPGFSLHCTCDHYTIVAHRHPPYGRTQET
jgi:hypothetical protein